MALTTSIIAFQRHCGTAIAPEIWDLPFVAKSFAFTAVNETDEKSVTAALEKAVGK